MAAWNILHNVLHAASFSKPIEQTKTSRDLSYPHFRTLGFGGFVVGILITALLGNFVTEDVLIWEITE